MADPKPAKAKSAKTETGRAAKTDTPAKPAQESEPSVHVLVLSADGPAPKGHIVQIPAADLDGLLEANAVRRAADQDFALAGLKRPAPSTRS